MNTSPETPDGGRLPRLDDDRVEAIEASLFGEIARDRTQSRKRRSRIWLATGAAAVVIVVAAAIAPTVTGLVSGSHGATAEAGSEPAPAMDQAGAGADSGMAATDEVARDPGGFASDAVGTAERDVITTASATVVVDDVADAARDVAQTAQDHGGYVESMSVGQSGQPIPVDPMSGISYDVYPSPDGAWITIKVPAEDLTSVVDELTGLGEVTASAINRQDVTQQTIDLQARIDSAQTSVDRLTELMSQATSLTDLLAAESALAERQETLESYQQQLEYLDDQVAMSSLTVTLLPVTEPVEADPAGFTDGLAAGWNGLIATLNGIVIALGFLIPWLVVAGVVALVVWAIVRSVRRRRTARAVAAAKTRADAAAMTGSATEAKTDAEA